MNILCIFSFFLRFSLGDLTAIRDAGPALEVLDIDGDGVIGLLDFIHFAARLKAIHQVRKKREADWQLLINYKDEAYVENYWLKSMLV